MRSINLNNKNLGPLSGRIVVLDGEKKANISQLIYNSYLVKTVTMFLIIQTSFSMW